MQKKKNPLNLKTLINLISLFFFKEIVLLF